MRFKAGSQAWHDECGVFGLLDTAGQRTDAARLAYRGLFALQHRGEDSAGIAVNNQGSILGHRGQGLVVESLDDLTVNLLRGHAAIGQVRYPAQGDTGMANAQPILVKHRSGQLAIGMNGALTNGSDLRRQLQQNGAIFQTASDAEILLALLARCRVLNEQTETAIASMIADLDGAYAVVLMTPGKVLGFRDPLGIRPLCLGRLGQTWLLASESCAIDAVGGEFVRDVLPGEIITLSAAGLASNLAGPAVDAASRRGCPCLFEYVYFARPDSILDGTDVQQSRFKAGQQLALEQPSRADLVIGVPDSGLSASMGYAQASGIPYGQGLLKNRYVGRAFIQPNPLQRELAVSLKFSALSHAVAGKRIVLVDDSLIRGTTTRHIVLLLKKAGAREVHLRLASPPIRFPCFYGVDTPSQDDLPACRMELPELCAQIGADSLGYLSLGGLKAASGRLDCGACSSCFDGSFPAGLPASAQNRIRRPTPDSQPAFPLQTDRAGEAGHA